MKADWTLPSQGKRRALLALLLISSLAVKFLFVFFFSNYTQHLISDMGFYWERAHARFSGNYFDLFQWHVNPPFFPMFLEQFFKILYFLGLSKHELPILMMFFMVLSTLSVFCVYDIAAKLTAGFWRAFGAAVLYAFCYPVVYLHAFVLTENLAIPLLIFVLWLVIIRDESPGLMFTAGLIFGVSTAIRMAFGLIGGFIFMYLGFSRPVSWKRIQRAMLFSLGFFLVIFFLLVENFFISKGELRGLAGYSGFNTFLQYCKVRNVFSHYSGYSGVPHYNNPTFLWHHPEFGSFHTDHAFSDRAYFLGLVKGCIQNNPSIWTDNLKFFKDIFLYPPWPQFSDVGGHSFWMPFFWRILLFLSLSVGLFYWIAPRDRLWISRLTLLLSPFFSASVMCYFFTMEGRLLIPALFGLFVAFFAALPQLFKSYVKMVVYYICLLIFFAGCSLASHLEKNTLQEKYGVSSVQKTDFSRVSVRVPDGTPGISGAFLLCPIHRAGFYWSQKLLLRPGK